MEIIQKYPWLNSHWQMMAVIIAGVMAAIYIAYLIYNFFHKLHSREEQQSCPDKIECSQCSFNMQCKLPEKDNHFNKK